MVRLADYIIEYLHKFGVKYVFMVTGSGAMFLNDAIGKNKNIKYICTHHEQAATMAAVAHAKYSGKLAVVCVTSGCGGTNTITGVLDAFQDSTPVLILSGQIKRSETIKNCGLNLRQFGVQEADIVTIVQSITKFAVMVEEPLKIRYYLEKALYFAFEGRPGPVWLDIPLDVQCADIDETNLEGFTPEPIKNKIPADEISKFVYLLNNSERPIIIAGHGIRLANAISEFKDFIESNQIPVVSTKLGLDILPHNHPLYVGIVGNKGDRAGNFAIQNSDLVISLGSRLSVCSTGHEYDTFAKEAKKVVVDIDPIEHRKKTVKIDIFIELDLKKFLSIMHYMFCPVNTKTWVKTCHHWKNIWKTYRPEFAQTEKINLYYFMEILSQKARSDDVIISDAGSFVPAQGFKIKDKQRIIFSGGQAIMGFTLPACIGVAFAKGGDVIGIAGDGSLQMNIHELQTIKYHNLPIKLFVMNNNGYLSIRNTQNNFFGPGHYVGVTPQTGLSFPNLEKIAYAYDLKYIRVSNSETLPFIIDTVLNNEGPMICEVMCLEDQPILTVASKQLPNGTFISRPLEDMYPFLPREEFFKEMIVKPLESSNE